MNRLSDKLLTSDYPDPLPAGSENRYYYHTDALGSVVALSNSSGLLAESYEYSPYGKACVYDAAGSYTGESSAYGNPYMFTARRYDPETGLYYYRARENG
jgi:hypothetical protein